MNKDDRYKAIRSLIETNEITTFAEIIPYLTKSVLAKALRKNFGRMDHFIEHPEEFSYKEIQQISQLMAVPVSTIIRLIDKNFS